jgi:hypothetical protein
LLAATPRGTFSLPVPVAGLGRPVMGDTEPACFLSTPDHPTGNARLELSGVAVSVSLFWGRTMTRQRWLRGTGLLASFLIAAAVGRADEAASVKVLEEAKATILRDDQKPDKPVVGVIMWGAGYNGGLLKELKELKNLQKLRIGGPWITDDGVQDLREIKTLQMLEIRSPKVSDAALKDLQEALPKLKLRRANPGETPFAAFAEKK